MAAQFGRAEVALALLARRADARATNYFECDARSAAATESVGTSRSAAAGPSLGSAVTFTTAGRGGGVAGCVGDFAGVRGARGSGNALHYLAIFSGAAELVGPLVAAGCPVGGMVRKHCLDPR